MTTPSALDLARFILDPTLRATDLDNLIRATPTPTLEAELTSLTRAEEHAWNLQAAIEESIQDMGGEPTGAVAAHIVRRLTTDGYLATPPIPLVAGADDPAPKKQTVGPREFAVRLALTEAKHLLMQSREYLFPWRGPSEGQMVERINDHLIAIRDALSLELDDEEESR